MRPLKTILIDDRETWRAWGDRWDTLVDHRPMRTLNWLLEWWDQFGSPSKSLFIHLFESNGELVGVAPLYLSGTGQRQVVRLLGDTGNICTDHTTWFARPEFSQYVGQTLAESLLQNTSWHRLHFEDVDPTDPALSATLDALQRQECILHFTPQESCWSIALPNSWNEYLNLLSRNRRKRTRKLVRDYFDTGRVRFHAATLEPQNWQTCWHQLCQLHALRWGTSDRPRGCFSDPRFTAFHENISQHLLQNGQLRLGYLALDGEPIAGEYQFLDADTLYCYQSGMSMSHEHVGPGNLSLIASLRFAIDHGLQRFDFLRGNEPYKGQWAGQPSARTSLRVWRRGLQGQLGFGLQWARRQAATWISR